MSLAPVLGALPLRLIVFPSFTSRTDIALANEAGPTIYERARPEGFLFL
jgi:hypothetical protein